MQYSGRCTRLRTVQYSGRCMCTAADGAVQRMVHSCGQCNTAGGAQLRAVPSSTVQNKIRCRPMTQFPYGWAPSEVFYNVPQLGNTPLK